MPTAKTAVRTASVEPNASARPANVPAATRTVAKKAANAELTANVEPSATAARSEH